MTFVTKRSSSGEPTISKGGMVTAIEKVLVSTRAVRRRQRPST